MDKIKGNLKRPEYIIGGCLLLLWLAFVGIYYINNRYCETIQDMGEVYDGTVYCAIEIGSDDEHIGMYGYCALPGESIATVDISLILWNEDQKIGYVVPTTFVERTDVNEMYNDEYDYMRSGFSATVEINDLEQGNYHIYIRYRNNDNNLIIDTEREIER